MQFFRKKIYCPNCKQELEKAPKRKSKCPFCKQYIYIHDGKLITEDESNYIFWMNHLPYLGINEPKFEKARDELSDRFKTRASVNDTVWYILNSLVDAHPFTDTAVAAYREMDRMANLEHKDGHQYLEQALRTQLQSYKLSGIKKVRVAAYVVNYNDEEEYDCEECAKYKRKVFTIDEALEKMPIPCKESFGCTCSYEPVETIGTD